LNIERPTSNFEVKKPSSALRPLHFWKAVASLQKSKIKNPKSTMSLRQGLVLHGALFPRITILMIAIRLSSELEDRLTRLAKKTGRTKTFYAREAIEQHLEDLEDYYLAVKASKNPGRLYSGTEAKRELGL